MGLVARFSSVRSDAVSFLQMWRSPMHSIDTTEFAGALISINGESPISLVRQGSAEEFASLDPRIVSGNPILIATGIDRRGKILIVPFGIVACNVLSNALTL